jgi:hypothetical protein
MLGIGLACDLALLRSNAFCRAIGSSIVVTKIRFQAFLQDLDARTSIASRNRLAESLRPVLSHFA